MGEELLTRVLASKDKESDLLVLCGAMKSLEGSDRFYDERKPAAVHHFGNLVAGKSVQ